MKHKITLYLEEEHIKKLKWEAVKQGKTVSRLLSELFEEVLY